MKVLVQTVHFCRLEISVLKIKQELFMMDVPSFIKRAKDQGM